MYAAEDLAQHYGLLVLALLQVGKVPDLERGALLPVGAVRAEALVGVDRLHQVVEPLRFQFS